MRKMHVQLVLHVFENGDEPPVEQIWKKTVPFETEKVHCLLLQHDDGQLVHNHIFSLRELTECGEEERIATYWPYASHVKLDLVNLLPNWGFVLQEQGGR